MCNTAGAVVGYAVGGPLGAKIGGSDAPRRAEKYVTEQFGYPDPAAEIEHQAALQRRADEKLAAEQNSLLATLLSGETAAEAAAREQKESEKAARRLAASRRGYESTFITALGGGPNAPNKALLGG